MHLFYCATAPEQNVLDEVESQHAVKVLRLAEGAAIMVTNGKGSTFEGVISKANFKKCEFSIAKHINTDKESATYIHIAIAPTKSSDRIEWFVEKCVEIGVDEISFIQCNHSEKKNLNLDRVVKVAVSAMKQSQKAHLPIINPLIPYKQFIKEAAGDQKFIAYVSDASVNLHLSKAARKDSKYIVLIGPEGDFSPTEIELALANKYTPVSLGTSRLRTETAGITACLALNLLQL